MFGRVIPYCVRMLMLCIFQIEMCHIRHIEKIKITINLIPLSFYNMENICIIIQSRIIRNDIVRIDVIRQIILDVQGVMQFDVQTRIISDIASSYGDIYEFITDVLVVSYRWIHFEKVSIWSFYTTEATAVVVWRQTLVIIVISIKYNILRFFMSRLALSILSALSLRRMPRSFHWFKIPMPTRGILSMHTTISIFTQLPGMYQTSKL